MLDNNFCESDLTSDFRLDTTRLTTAVTLTLWFCLTGLTGLLVVLLFVFCFCVLPESEWWQLQLNQD